MIILNKNDFEIRVSGFKKITVITNLTYEIKNKYLNKLIIFQKPLKTHITSKHTSHLKR
jgi:hypothetical protein